MTTSIAPTGVSSLTTSVASSCPCTDATAAGGGATSDLAATDATALPTDTTELADATAGGDTAATDQALTGAAGGVDLTQLATVLQSLTTVIAQLASLLGANAGIDAAGGAALTTADPSATASTDTTSIPVPTLDTTGIDDTAGATALPADLAVPTA